MLGKSYSLPELMNMTVSDALRIFSTQIREKLNVLQDIELGYESIIGLHLMLLM